MTTTLQRLVAAGGALALAFGAGQSTAAAFALQETSSSGLGNAFAGGAAAAEDAATVWANPAGMSQVCSSQTCLWHGVLAGHFIRPSAKFSNHGSIAAAQQPLGNDGGDPNSGKFVPNGYLVVKINNDWRVGLGINTPFGLVTDYNNGWVGRYQAITSDVTTYNVNPSLSFTISPNFTIGVGVNWQKINSKFTSNINYSGVLAQVAVAAAAGGLIPPAVVPPFLGATTGLDGKAHIDGDDTAWGWNIGALWQANDCMRFGLHYRSSIKYKVNGDVKFTLPSAPPLPPGLAPVYAALSGAVNANPALANGGVQADIELPPLANLSLVTTLNGRWDLMADAQWTGWSTVENLTFVRNTGAVLQSTPERFKDVWRLSVGATYKPGDPWKFRAGVAYDQTPVPDKFRTPRLPDSDRVWLAGGAQWSHNKLNVDLSAAYIFLNDGSIKLNGNPPSTAQNALLKGDYSHHAFVVSGQASYSF